MLNDTFSVIFKQRAIVTIEKLWNCDHGHKYKYVLKNEETLVLTSWEMCVYKVCLINLGVVSPADALACESIASSLSVKLFELCSTNAHPISFSSPSGVVSLP